jgi:4-amino-4-deoxy-L-arabinose transferase-like glycosyltransferase
MVTGAIILRWFSISPFYTIAADGPSYISIASGIADNFSFKGSIHYPPGYPVLISLARLLIEDPEKAGQLVSLAMGSLLVIPVYFCGRLLFDSHTAWLSAATVAVWPSFISLSTQVLAIATYVTLLSCGVTLLWIAATKNRWLVAATSGIFFAGAYLTRQEAVFSFLACCLGLTLHDIMERKRPNGLIPLIITLSVSTVITFPYLLMVAREKGYWTLAAKSEITFTDCLARYLDRPDLIRDPAFTKIGLLDLIHEYPGFFTFNTATNLADLATIINPLLLALAILGAWKLANDGRKGVLTYITAAFLPVIVLVVLFFVSDAYVAPYTPFLLMLGVHGLLEVDRRMRTALLKTESPLRKIPLLSLICILALTTFVVVKLAPFRTPVSYSPEIDDGRFDQKKIGLILKEYLPTGSKIMTRSVRIGYYSGHPRVDIPPASMYSIVGIAVDHNVTHLIVDGKLKESHPQLEGLLTPLDDTTINGCLEFTDQTSIRPGFFRRLVCRDTASRGVVVYEFKPEFEQIVHGLH